MPDLFRPAERTRKRVRSTPPQPTPKHQEIPLAEQQRLPVYRHRHYSRVRHQSPPYLRGRQTAGACRKHPAALQRGHFREITETESQEAERGMPCEAARPAIIVYGRRVGTTLTVCTDDNCPVHNPRAAARLAQGSAPIMEPAPDLETEEEAIERKDKHEQQRREYAALQERRAGSDGRKRSSKSERLRPNRPAGTICGKPVEPHSSASWQRLQRTSVRRNYGFCFALSSTSTPYTFADDVADEMPARDENEQRTTEDVLSAAVDRSKTKSSPALPCVSPLRRMSASRVKESWTIYAKRSSSSCRHLSGPAARRLRALLRSVRLRRRVLRRRRWRP